MSLGLTRLVGLRETKSTFAVLDFGRPRLVEL